MIDVNIKGVLYGIAAALPYMQEQKFMQSSRFLPVGLSRLYLHPPE